MTWENARDKNRPQGGRGGGQVDEDIIIPIQGTQGTPMELYVCVCVCARSCTLVEKKKVGQQ